MAVANRRFHAHQLQKLTGLVALEGDGEDARAVGWVSLGPRGDFERIVRSKVIPAIAKLFIKVPDAQIWLTTPPAGFLRWEGAMAEPDDQIIRVDLLPGGTSEAAVPVATTAHIWSSHERGRAGSAR